MLEYLRIRNLALIEDVELEFAPGMNVLTGETGAGKSFILKALGFLLGEKLTPDMVRPNCERAQVEAVFMLPHADLTEELVLRRELMADTGRSRLYYNDKVSSQESIKDLRSSLIAHTSQHGQQKLLQTSYQAQLIDNALPNKELLLEKDLILKELHEVFQQRKALQKKLQQLADRRDLLEMQQQEIDKVDPEPGEEDRLEAQRLEAKEAATLTNSYEHALALLHGSDGPGLLEQLGALESELLEMAKLDDTLLPDHDSVAALRQNLSHLERRFRRPPEFTSPVDMDALEERLYELSQLKRKLRRSLEEIITMRQEIADNLSFLDACGLDITALDRQEADLAEKLQGVLAQLVPARQEAGKVFATALEQELAGLGFSEHVRVQIDFSPVEVWAGIFDEKARILWAPNPGQVPQPLDRIASGGELSRFLLALVGIQDSPESVTYIFDEVDAGVGGLTLNRVADRLAALAKRRQMLLITHWPQLAARAARHFSIQKQVRDDNTFVMCTPLQEAAIKDELARMAGGGEQGAAMANSLV